MTTETETILIKMLDELRVDVKNIQNSLTDLKVGQARIEGDVKTTQVEVQNIKEDVRELKTTYKWVIGLIVTLGVGVGVLILNAFNLISTKG